MDYDELMKRNESDEVYEQPLVEFKRKQKLIMIDFGNTELYEIDLEDSCGNSADLVDWIYYIRTKTNNPQILNDFLTVFSDAFQETFKQPLLGNLRTEWFWLAGKTKR